MKKSFFWWYLAAAQIVFFFVYFLSDFLPEKHYSDSILIAKLAASCEFEGVMQDGYKGVGLLYCPLFVVLDNVSFVGWLQFLLVSLLFYYVCNVSELKAFYYFFVVFFLGAFAIYYSIPSKDFLVSLSLLLLAASARSFKLAGVIFYLLLSFLVRKQLALILIVSFFSLVLLRLFGVRKSRGYVAVYVAILCFYLLGWQFIYGDGVTSIRDDLTTYDYISPVETLVTNLYATNNFAGDASNYFLGVITALFPFLFFESFKFYYVPFYFFVPIFFVAATYAATKGSNHRNGNPRVLIRVYIFAYTMVVLGYYPDYGALVRYLVPVALLVFMQQSYIYKTTPR